MLYMLPTLICIIPNKTVHMVALAVGAAMRGLFLARNLGQRIRSGRGILYFVVGGAELIYFFLAINTFFAKSLSTHAVIASPTTGHAMLIRSGAHY